MSLKGKKVAILVENMYDEKELWYPAIRLKEEEADVTLVGPAKGNTYESKHGLPATADVSAADVKGGDFDAVIIPGGYSPDHMRRTPAMVQFVKDANAKGKVIGAICHAGWMLVSADALRGKKATSFYSIKDDLVAAGAKWVDEEVVQDGNLITSRNPNDLPVFCRTIIAALEGK
ncbi:MAG: type 1 glutamine amidotransferase [Dehalococcoidales bacterium]|nr:type 1 glutamine amidotransferase [Dehalococcoidales bacterium]